MHSPTGFVRYLNLILMAQLIIFTGVVSAQSPSFTQIRELAAQTRYVEAHQQLELYLESNPVDEQARLLNGVLLTRLNRVNEAIKVFEQLAKDNPQLPEPHNNLAVLFAAQGRFEDARRSLLEAIELQPNYDTARENLGDIYARLADIEYRKAHEINKENTRTQRKADTISALFENLEDNPSSETPAQAAKPEPEPEPLPVPEAKPEPDPKSAEPPKQTPTEPKINTETPSAKASSASTCIKIANIKNARDVDTMVSWLSEKGARVLHADNEENETVSGYQLYIPPLADKSQRQQLMQKLKTAGIKDFYLIGSGTLRNGLSLGVYTTDSASARRMKKLRASGFNVERRSHTFLKPSTGKPRNIQADISSTRITGTDINRAFSKYTAHTINCR